MLYTKLRLSKCTAVLVTMGLMIACIWIPNVEAASMYAGVAVRNITAVAPTKHVHDPLYAKALVLDDGTTKAVIICADIIGATETLTSEVRRRVQEELGINQKNILLNASHNHNTWNQTATDMDERIVSRMKDTRLCKTVSITTRGYFDGKQTAGEVKYQGRRTKKSPR